MESKDNYTVTLESEDNYTVTLESEDNCSITLEAIYHFHKGRNNFVLLCFSAIFVLGVVGNGSLLYLFFREKKLRDVNNAFIINLAFADFLFVLFFVPSSIFENFFYFRPFGVLFCRILTLVTFCSHDVSILSLVVLSYFRYRAVVHPMEHFTKHRLNRTIMVCVATWLVAVSSAVFPMTRCTRVCVVDFIDLHMLQLRSTYHYHTGRFFILYLVPLAVISCVYVTMAIKLVSGGPMLRRNDSISARRAMQSRQRLGIIVVILIVIFAASWLPRYILVFTLYLANSTDTTNLQHASNISIALGSSLNPIALYSASTVFRSHFRKHILFCLPNDQDSPFQGVTMTSLKPSSRNGVGGYKTSKAIENSTKTPNSSTA